MRLFTAFDPPDAVRRDLVRLFRSVPGVRWTPAEQIHLTLRFLGERDGRLLTAVAEALKQVHAPPFSIRLKGTGKFPARGRPRILWTGVEPKEPVLALHRALEQALRAAGIAPEERPFSPHLTIARLRDAPLRPVEAFLAEAQSFESEPFPVSEFSLFSSLLTLGGAIHKKENTFPLA